MYWCDKCKIWEHEKCLADAIRKQYLKEYPSATGTNKARKPSAKNIVISISAKDQSGGVTADISKKRGGTQVSIKEEGDANVKTESQQQDVGSIVVPVKCLKCGNALT
jgi:hypothetical protein